jgi:hypothetical protein
MTLYLFWGHNQDGNSQTDVGNGKRLLFPSQVIFSLSGFSIKTSGNMGSLLNSTYLPVPFFHPFFTQEVPEVEYGQGDHNPATTGGHPLGSGFAVRYG